MKKLCLLLACLMMFTMFSSCSQVLQEDESQEDESQEDESQEDGSQEDGSQEDEPHALTYHEIMSLPTPMPDMVGNDDNTYWAYTDIYEFLKNFADLPFACVKVECIDVTYYLEWNAEEDTLKTSYTEYKINIKKVGTSCKFDPSDGKASIVESRVTIGPSFRNEKTETAEIYQQRLESFKKDFLLSHGGVENPKTGKVSLESGIYEFIPMSDMSLQLEIPENYSIPMNAGEYYTAILLPGQRAGGSRWTIHHMYPATKNALVFENRFYNLPLAEGYYNCGAHNMHIVAYLSDKSVDFEVSGTDTAK